MKLGLISEATIQQVEKRIPIWIKKYFDGDEQEAFSKIPNIIQADPTNGKYSEWLIQQYKKETARFPEDTPQITKNLKQFHQKNQN